MYLQSVLKFEGILASFSVCQFFLEQHNELVMNSFDAGWIPNKMKTCLFAWNRRSSLLLASVGLLKNPTNITQGKPEDSW